MKSKLDRDHLSWVLEARVPTHQDIIKTLRYMAASTKYLGEPDLAEDIEFIADRYTLEISAGARRDRERFRPN